MVWRGRRGGTHTSHARGDGGWRETTLRGIENQEDGSERKKNRIPSLYEAEKLKIEVLTASSHPDPGGSAYPVLRCEIRVGKEGGGIYLFRLIAPAHFE